jgi:hypothetical protein
MTDARARSEIISGDGQIQGGPPTKPISYPNALSLSPENLFTHGRNETKTHQLAWSGGLCRNNKVLPSVNNSVLFKLNTNWPGYMHVSLFAQHI